MSSGQTEIRMDPPTVEALHGGGFRLYGFRAVKSRNRAARGLVLWARQDFSVTTSVRLEPVSRASTSFDPIEAGRQIRSGFSSEISPGQTLVFGTGGTGRVERQGPPNALGFLNDGPRSMTCSVAESHGGEVVPYCALPVFPGFAEAVETTAKVLLTFSTTVLLPGTVVESLFELSGRGGRVTARTGTSPGVLADLAAPGAQELRFGLATGWQTGGGVWARPVSPLEDLTPLLIEEP